MDPLFVVCAADMHNMNCEKMDYKNKHEISFFFSQMRQFSDMIKLLYGACGLNISLLVTADVGA